MPIAFDLSAPHTIVAANSHFYEKPTEPLYLDRVLRYHDLIYLENGQWLITEGETDYLLEKDDILLLSAEHHHYTRLSCAPNTRTVCIHVTNEPGDLDPLRSTLTLPVSQNAKSAPVVKEYFEKIVSEFWSDRPFRKERMSSLFNLLMFALADLTEGARGEERGLAEGIINLVNATPHKKFTLTEIAERFHVSPKTVEGVMRRGVGVSFAKYQMTRKLEMIARQIEAEPYIRFAEIASIFGFSDEFHLSRSFKARYGVSPSQYRQSVLEKQRDER